MMGRFFTGSLLLLALTFDAGAQRITRYVADGTTGSVQPVADPGDIIIEFAAAPLLTRDTKAGAADLDALFARLERDLSSIEHKRSIATTNTVTPLVHRYTHAFAGASAHVSAESVPQIRQLGPSASCAVLVEGEGRAPRYHGVAEALAEPDTQLRLFGKPAVSGRRRMAVTLARAGSIDAARTKACAAAEKISVQMD